ncbi:MAG TPA: DNA-formamidopyrimidine glycosylase family protein, partial [Candidatus Limnocylindrales bacterium]|nr:DNA-formamidopyrimidine glycosylase family protein [Candidatus Limnocylindrales bacterium]
MPELPEVETVARDLQRWVAGATIAGAEVRWARTIRHPQPPERFVAEIAGATIRRVDRRAKTVLFHLEDGRVMTVALRMTGALIVAPAGTADDPYARVVFDLADGRQ